MMKKTITTTTLIILMTVLQAFAHSDQEIGPNGGRILELSKDQTIHGEVTLTNGQFYVALLGKDMKLMEIKDQTLVVSGGARTKPEKPKIEIIGNHFVFSALKGDTYLLVFQFKQNKSSKQIIARFEYDSAICGSCKKGEWLCDCGAKTKPDPKK